MLQRMSSAITQKMMGVVEQKRALLLEQQNLERQPSKKSPPIVFEALEKINKVEESELPEKTGEEAKVEDA